MYLELKRIEENNKQTIGHLFVRNQDGGVLSIFSTLELPYRENKVQKSCIPTGKYQVVKRWSLKYGSHFHILDVTGRSMILIHKGNYYNQTLGCVLIGYYHSDINADGMLDVVSSTIAMNALNALITQKITYMEVSSVYDLEVK
jgi:hypothetical protein